MTLHSREKKARLAELQRLCRERRIPVTVQRRIIFEAVLESNGHPSAEEIYQTVLERLPGISRATVYRVLEMLASLGVIGKPSHLGSAMRYDMNTHRHHHLVCIHCEKTIDIEDPALNALVVPQTGESGFQISDYSVHFMGLCRTCQKGAGQHRTQKNRKEVSRRKAAR